MTDQMTDALPGPAFQLKWRDGAYYVSEPNIGNTDVYTADQMRAHAAQELAARLRTLSYRKRPSVEKLMAIYDAAFDKCDNNPDDRLAPQFRAIEAVCAALNEKTFPERFGCNGPEGTFWTDDAVLANNLIKAAFDRDEWTVTDMQNPTGKALSEQHGEADRGQD